MPNHTLTEVQSFALPSGLSGDWTVEAGRIVLGAQPGNGLSLDEAALAPLAARGPWAPHVRPVRAGWSLSLHPGRESEPR